MLVFRIDVIKVIGDKSVTHGVVLYEDPGLKVYAMDWCWTLCFKLTRFDEQDEIDITALLLHLGMLPTAGDIEGSVVELGQAITPVADCGLAGAPSRGDGS